MATKHKFVDGEWVTAGIYGKIRVASIHPNFGYEVVFYCEPPLAGSDTLDNTRCDKCKFKFKCFTDEEIHVVFRGSTLGIFPKWWRQPQPNEEELERYLFGRVTHVLIFRESGGLGTVYYGKEFPPEHLKLYALRCSGKTKAGEDCQRYLTGRKQDYYFYPKFGGPHIDIRNTVWRCYQHA